MTDVPQPLTDREVRSRVRFIADQLVRAQRDILARRTGRDGRWEPPGDLADYGDGTGLMAIVDHELIGAMGDAIEKAQADLRALREEIEADKRRRLGPGYMPMARGD